MGDERLEAAEGGAPSAVGFSKAVKEYWVGLIGAWSLEYFIQD